MFKIVVRNATTFLVAMGVALVPLNFLASYLQRNVAGGAGFMDLLEDPFAAQAGSLSTQTGVEEGLYAVVSLVMALVVTPALYGVAVAIAARAWQGGRPQPADGWRAGRQRLWALVGTLILTYLCLAAVVAPVALVVVLLEPIAGPLVIIAAVLLVPVALVIAVAVAAALSLAVPAVVLEGAGPVTALRRSARLVRARFWPRVGTLILLAIVIALIAGILAFPLVGIGAFFGGTVGWVLTAVGSILSGMVSTPLIGAGLTLVYLDARIRHEGLDLQLAADRMAGGQPAVADPFGRPQDRFGGGPGY